MATFRLCYLIVFILLTSCGQAFADGNLEIGITGGYTGNLLTDSSDQDDSFTMSSASLKLYPLPLAEIRVNAGYTYYGKLYSLSNFLYGADLTLIPTSVTSSFHLYLTAGFQERAYRERDTDVFTTDFNSSEYSALVSLGYDLTSTKRIRAAISTASTGFNHDEINDRTTYDFLLGINISLPGASSFDLEGGYSTGNLDFLDPETGGIRPDKAYSLLTDGKLKSFYISPRFTRSFGNRTGLSVSFSHRSFVDTPPAVIYGYSTGLLSPWSSVYEGNALKINIKTFLIPRVILTAGFGLWEKTYLNTLEQKEVSSPFGPGTNLVISTIFAESRQDDQTRLVLAARMPLTSGSSWFLEPFLQIEYTNNSSSIVVYDYSATSATTGINIRY